MVPMAGEKEDEKGGPDVKWKVSTLQVNVSGSSKSPEQRSSKRKQRRKETEALSGQIQTSSMGVMEEIMKTETIPKKKKKKRL